MAALAVVNYEGSGMAERSNVGVGFTDEDRKVLITVQVKMERLESDVRDGLGRIAKLEADRVTRKDIEDLLAVIEEKTDENAHLAKTSAAFEVRISELERRVPEQESIKKYVFMGIGGLAALEVLLGFLFKK